MELKDPFLGLTLDGHDLLAEGIKKMEFAPEKAMVIIHNHDGSLWTITDINVVVYNLLAHWAQADGEIECVYADDTQMDGGEELILGEKFELKRDITNRGFTIFEFTDRYGEGCSLQKSSLATEDAVWLGITNPIPRIMASKTPQCGTGWVDYALPEDVDIRGRMHLTQPMAAALIEKLLPFVKTGQL